MATASRGLSCKDSRGSDPNPTVSCTVRSTWGWCCRPYVLLIVKDAVELVLHLSWILARVSSGERSGSSDIGKERQP